MIDFELIAEDDHATIKIGKEEGLVDSVIGVEKVNEWSVYKLLCGHWLIGWLAKLLVYLTLQTLSSLGFILAKLIWDLSIVG